MAATPRPNRWKPWLLLATFFVLTGVANGTYAGLDVEPSAPFAIAQALGNYLFLWHWFSSQMAPYRRAWPPDMGVVILWVWPLAMPYHLWRYERWRGILKVAGVFTMWVAALCLTWAAWLLVRWRVES